MRIVTWALFTIPSILAVGCSNEKQSATSVPRTVSTVTQVTTSSQPSASDVTETCGLTLTVPSLRNYCGAVGIVEGEGLRFDHPDDLVTRYAIDVQNTAGQSLVFGALYVGESGGVPNTDSAGNIEGDLDLYFLARDSGDGPVITDIIQINDADDFRTEDSNPSVVVIVDGDVNPITTLQIVGTNFVYKAG